MLQPVTNLNDTLSKLTDILWSHGNFLDEYTSTPELYPVHITKLASAITRQETIRFVLPAFPAKSNNREKTFSSQPDFGEVLALKRLNNMTNRLAKEHPPGASVVICSDGRVFSDLVGVSEADVSSYSTEIQSIVTRFGLTNISFYNLEDIYPGKYTFDQMRYHLEKDYSSSLEELRRQIKSDGELQCLFNGIHRFIKEDFLVLKEGMSRNQIEKLAKNTAYQVIRRSNAWSHLIEDQFPDAVRLSIHPQKSTSEKFPIKLLPSQDKWGTPWHRVPVVENGILRLMRQKDAKACGAELKIFNDRYIYFEKEERA